MHQSTGAFSQKQRGAPAQDPLIPPSAPCPMCPARGWWPCPSSSTNQGRPKTWAPSTSGMGHQRSVQVTGVTP